MQGKSKISQREYNRLKDECSQYKQALEEIENEVVKWGHGKDSSLTIHDIGRISLTALEGRN